MRLSRLATSLSLLSTIALAAGCGSSSSTASNTPASGTSAQHAASGQSAQGALTADAHSAATGDIPDNQVFLTFSAQTAGFSMKYPEGWTRSGSGSGINFADKNNLVRVSIRKGGTLSIASVGAQLSALARTNPRLTYKPPTAITLPAGAAVKAVYSTQSAPDPVTGRRVTLIVNRYELAHRGRLAVVDLGTPVGVDNVDAYRMMIESFRWR